MNVTEVRVKLVNERAERVKAFCSVTLDKDFVIRDLKVIEGTHGLFVAMPSRKLADKCGKCGTKNHLRARFCNHCGVRLNENRAGRDTQGRTKLHADVAHPINAMCREMMQEAVVVAFNRELERSLQPGYKPQLFEGEEEFESGEYDDFIAELRETIPAAGQPASRVDRMPREDRRELASPIPAGRPAYAESSRSTATVRERTAETVSRRSEPVAAPDDSFSAGIL
jgi:stage V sporulation protein G